MENKSIEVHIEEYNKKKTKEKKYLCVRYIFHHFGIECIFYDICVMVVDVTQQWLRLKSSPLNTSHYFKLLRE